MSLYLLFSIKVLRLYYNYRVQSLGFPKAFGGVALENDRLQSADIYAISGAIFLRNIF